MKTLNLENASKELTSVVHRKLSSEADFEVKTRLVQYIAAVQSDMDFLKQQVNQLKEELARSKG